MSSPPDFLDPWRAAEQGKHFEGAIALSLLPRLSGLLVSAEGEARFELEFFRDEKRRSCVRGKVAARLKLRCQRCLEAVEYEVESRLLLGLVQGLDEAERLPDEYDPLMVENDRFQPADLVEDELILGLPQVPMHTPPDACGDQAARLASEQASSDEPGAENPDNPFRVLAQLKKSMH